MNDDFVLNSNSQLTRGQSTTGDIGLRKPTLIDLKEVFTDTLKASVLAQFLTSVAFSLMGSFMPLFIKEDLGETLVSATYWTGASSFAWYGGLALTAPIWGWVCDRVGTRRVLLVVFAGNIATYAGMAFSQNVYQLVALRVVQSLFGGLSTILFIVAGVAAPPDKLKQYISYQIVAMTIANLVSPGIGGALAAVVGYRWTLFSQAVLFASMIPLVLIMKTAKPVKNEGESFTSTDFRAILPTALALAFAYAGINFIQPIIPLMLSNLGIGTGSLLLWTTVATIANAICYAVATPVMTKLAAGARITLFQLATAIVIEATTFAFSPIVFIIMRVAISVIQAGLPQNLMGGKSGTTGRGMGILNSARYLGMALGMYISPSILQTGAPPIYMYSVLAAGALLSAVITFRFPKNM